MWNDLPVINEGMLKKRKEWRGWDRRWVVLRKDLLQYFKKRGDTIPIREISMKQCMIKKSTEKFSFELHSPLLLDRKNKEGRMYFSAESEQELQKWLLALRRCDGQTQELREKRTTARSYLDLDKRTDLCKLTNKRGETALHMVCSGASPGSLSVEIALWLAENGETMEAATYEAVFRGSIRLNFADTLFAGSSWLNQLNIDGNSALHLAVSNGYVDLAAALVRKGADMSLKNSQGQTPLDLISSTRDVERICMVGNIGASSRRPLLGPPKGKVRGCTYLTMLVEKVTLQGARGFDCPFVRISVYNRDRQLVEEAQEVPRFAHRNDTCLWYTRQYHMQVPLENTTDSFILLELVDEAVRGRSKVTAETKCWSFLRLKDGSVDTTTHSLECYAPPVRLGLGENVRRERDELVVSDTGGFFGVDTYLTTRGSSKRG